MGALGYVNNKKPFQELARCLPLQILESSALEQDPRNRLAILQSMLLGAAGLLPSQCEGRSRFGERVAISDLEEVWHSLDAESRMSYGDWRFFRTHPKNFPTVRLLGAAYLVDRYLERGLHEGMLDLVRAASPGKRAISIEEGFLVSDLIGQERAREIAVNVILPFFFALAETNSQSDLERHVLELYRSYPKLGENQITRYLSTLFWGSTQPKTIDSARCQQGLIHLYKTFCQEQRCETCPVNALSN